MLPLTAVVETLVITPNQQVALSPDRRAVCARGPVLALVDLGAWLGDPATIAPRVLGPEAPALLLRTETEDR